MPFLLSSDPQQEPIELGNLHTFGSDETCQTCLKDPQMNERHFRIECRGEVYFLRDLRSTSGTFVNGKRVSEIELQPEDEIEAGEQRMTFVLTRPKHQPFSITSKNLKWNEQLTRLGSAARTDFPVLLLGPSGAGKEVLATALHAASNRNHRAMVTVNCSALTETLIESELFGHVKGSFTGALADRKGAFQLAHKGTLFLDEIGDLPYHLQAKLLRALENNEIRPVGSDQTIQTNVRVVAATHQNLQERIRSKQFRTDLYYRLNVLEVTTPGLDDRKEDFDSLLVHFSKQYRVAFSIPAMKKLKSLPWPGNIRELRNTVARASALFPRIRIEEEHLAAIKDMPCGTPLAESGLPMIREMERNMIVNQLRAHRGNQRRAALELGLPKSTLNDRLRDYKINPRDFIAAGPTVF